MYVHSDLKMNLFIYFIAKKGLMSCPKKITVDGFETQFQVNYLSHYLFTRLLLNQLALSPSPRIINVTSKLYESEQFFSFISF
jgi:NAD(P)-dependent dehydrogenase (short-subunit alcohol dehydrogenase family)